MQKEHEQPETVRYSFGGGRMSRTGAFSWSWRRKLETHPSTEAAQLVEIRDTVTEIAVAIYVQTELLMPWKVAFFAHKDVDCDLGKVGHTNHFIRKIQRMSR